MRSELRVWPLLTICSAAALILTSCSWFQNPDREYLRTSGEVSESAEDSPWYNRGGLRDVFGDFQKVSSVVVPETPKVAELREKGRYLAESVAACGACHGVKPGDPSSPLAGGRPMQDRFGTVYAANITPDRTTGVGKWNVIELMRAIRGSIDREGKPLSIDLHESFRWMSDQDAKAIALYLLALQPVKNEVKRRELGGFERNKWGLFPQHREVAGYVPALPDQTSPGRGRYLATNVAQCQTCHSGASGAFSGYGESKGGMMGLVKAVFELLSPQQEQYEEDVAAFLSDEGKQDYAAEMESRTAEREGREPIVKQNKEEKIESIYQEALTEGRFPVSGPDIRGTAATGLASWSETDITQYLSTGRTPKGEERERRFCPWPFYSSMSDADKRSLALFLKRL